MVRLPWAKGNLLIAFSEEDIIKELGPCVRIVSCCFSVLNAQSESAERGWQNRTDGRDKRNQQIIQRVRKLYRI